MKIFNNRYLLLALAGVELFFMLAYLVASMGGHRSLKVFDLNGEANIPAWFASIQLFLIGQQFLCKCLKEDNRVNEFRNFFLLVGFIFIFLSLDESAAIHERITSVFKNLNWIPRFNGNHGIWIFLYVPAILAFFLITFKKIFILKRVFPEAFRLMSCGGALYIGGAVLLEIVGYQFIVNQGPALHYCEVALEEFLEMFGATLILMGAFIINGKETLILTFEHSSTAILSNKTMEPGLMFSSAPAQPLGTALPQVVEKSELQCEKE